MNLKIWAFLFVVFYFCTQGTSQRIFSLPSLPEPVANNAVVGDPATGRIYSFSGIDSSLLFSGIHAKSFIYDPLAREWTQIDDLPSTTPRIAASANILNDTIYVVGGYQVNPNGSEVSLNDVHKLGLNNTAFSSDAPEIPLAIDDHVQEIIGDSALIQFSGWSNTGNTGLVQHFTPKTQQWNESTRIRNQFLEAFGAAGVAIGDTLYYIGGAADVGDFPIQPYLRKGAINPKDISDISWSYTELDLAATYRPGSFRYDNKAYWIGGGENTYNYDGIAYDGSGVVQALSQLLEYDPKTGLLRKINITLPAVMDIRGIAQISNTEFCVVGGMGSNQDVLDNVWCIDMSTVVSIDDISLYNYHLAYPNPTLDVLKITPTYSGPAEIINQEGQLVYSQEINDSYINIQKLKPGIYYLQLGGSKASPIKFIKSDR